MPAHARKPRCVVLRHPRSAHPTRRKAESASEDQRRDADVGSAHKERHRREEATEYVARGRTPTAEEPRRREEPDGPQPTGEARGRPAARQRACASEMSDPVIVDQVERMDGKYGSERRHGHERKQKSRRREYGPGAGHQCAECEG